MRSRGIKFFCLNLVLSLFLAVSACHPQQRIREDFAVPNNLPPKNVKIIIDPAQTYQTVEGFGVSGAWWAQEVGGWQSDNRERVIKLLFDPDKGIGLTGYRYNIGAGAGAEIQDPWRRTESFEITREIYDWSRDSNAIRILELAYQAGATQLVAFANSPPARLTRSGMVSGAIDGQSNLGLNQEEAYAVYLADIIRHLREDRGLPIQWLSPVNEPQWKWNSSNNQEGCHYSPEEVVALLEALDKKIKEYNLEVNLLAPESGNWRSSRDFLNALANNPDLLSSLSVFSVHSYDSLSEDKKILANLIRTDFPHLRLWMTEWVEMRTGRDYGMTSAVTLAETIHQDLSLGGVTSWQYWIAVSKYDYHDGLLYINPGFQAVIETKRLWALGNYSKFIRPGYQRIDSQTDSPNLLVSAYQSPDQGQIAVVVINKSVSPVLANLQIQNRNWFKLDAYSTSEQNNLAQIYQGATPGNFTFPAFSITTLLVRP
jgi:O-glycosyl hydrolase